MTNLVDLERRLAEAQAEVARLQAAIADHPDSPPLGPVLPSLPSPTAASLPPLPPSLLNEPWAAPPSSELCKILPWLQGWKHSYPPPAVPANDHKRARAAAKVVSVESAEDEEVLSRLCQLARLIFQVQFAAVNIVAKDRVHFKGSDIVHPPLVGMKGAPREVSICNW